MSEEQTISTADPSRADLNSTAKFLTDKLCGVRYEISSRHWRRLVDSGRAPQPTRFGGATRWSVAALEEWEAAGCRPIRSVSAR